MHETIQDALANEAESYRTLEQLHDVPPHEVWVVRVDGKRAVCKYDVDPTGAAGVEGRVMALLDDRTSLSVPAVLHVGEGHYLAAWHPDAPDPTDEHAADEVWARAAGRALATLHAETAPFVDGYGRFEPDGKYVTTAGHETWRDAVLAYLRRHRTVPAEHGFGDVVDAVVEYVVEHPDAFAGAGDPVCCHGWWSPEHVTVDDGRVSCVVDFEHAIAAPGEYDYWRTVLPTFGPDADAARLAFREAYESVRPFQPGFERRREAYALLSKVYYFESLYVQAQHGPEATAERAQRLRDNIHDSLDELT